MVLDGRLVGNGIYNPCLVTKSLVFCGIGRSASRMSRGMPLFKAYDKSTGAEVWEIELPNNATGGPMTYLSGGKQYIVVASGGGRSERPGRLTALSLP